MHPFPQVIRPFLLYIDFPFSEAAQTDIAVRHALSNAYRCSMSSTVHPVVRSLSSCLGFSHVINVTCQEAVSEYSVVSIECGDNYFNGLLRYVFKEYIEGRCYQKTSLVQPT